MLLSKYYPTNVTKVTAICQWSLWIHWCHNFYEENTLSENEFSKEVMNTFKIELKKKD